MIECCSTCNKYMKLEKSDYSGKGCKHSDYDGFACLAFADEGIVVHMVGVNPDKGMCELHSETCELRPRCIVDGRLREVCHKIQEAREEVVNCFPQYHKYLRGEEGTWVKDEGLSAKHIEPIYVCSVCGEQAWGDNERSKYCPNCGVRMKLMEE